MKKIAYIGVDPGKSGFISILSEGSWKFYPMPTIKVDTGEVSKTGKPVMKTEYYEKGLFTVLLDDILRDFPKDEFDFIAAIEKVGGRRGWSAQNNFEFGRVAGMQKMVLHALDAEIEEVRPQKWQTFVRQGYPNLKKLSSSGKTQVSDPKAVAELIVETEFPHIDFRKTTRARTNDDNKVDSFLICLYKYRSSNQ